MTDRPRQSGESPEDQAPELHNSEQDDEFEQAHSVASDARNKDAEGSPLDSVKPRGGGGVDGNSQDLIDHMRDMEQSGRIDMGAYRGEPNMDDNEDKYGEDNKLDDLPADGSIGGNPADEDD